MIYLALGAKKQCSRLFLICMNYLALDAKKWFSIIKEKIRDKMA
jgi:hypothetical protein